MINNNMKTFTTIKDFFHYVNNFKGETEINNLCAYHNGEILAKLIIFKKPKIYISGKITGCDLAERENTFGIIEKELSKDYIVINPMTLSKKIGYDKEYSFYLKIDIKHLLDCDCIYMMKDYIESQGALLELEIAKKCGLQIIYQ